MAESKELTSRDVSKQLQRGIFRLKKMERTGVWDQFEYVMNDNVNG